MENFTPYSALAGGTLIGLASALLLAANGRIAGISGILAGALVPSSDGKAWRGLFLIGMIAGCWVIRLLTADATPVTISASPVVLVIAGLLVGFGTRLANGCTSGHAICGIARLSPRSIGATITFMASGALTVFVARHLLGA